MPSQEKIDYVKQYNTILYRGVGRNDPCPCKSGHKFKKCHGATV
jgi:preprotein translocase subunit SecA